MSPDSFDAWLADKIGEVLRPGAGGRSLVVWCDPAGQWLDTLHRHVSRLAALDPRMSGDGAYIATADCERDGRA